MPSKKPHFNLRLRKDRLDLLKAIHRAKYASVESVGGKVPSFNAFMEEVVELYLSSERGQLMCDVVDRMVESERKRRIKEKINSSMDEENF